MQCPRSHHQSCEMNACPPCILIHELSNHGMHRLKATKCDGCIMEHILSSDWVTWLRLCVYIIQKLQYAHMMYALIHGLTLSSLLMRALSSQPQGEHVDAASRISSLKRGNECLQYNYLNPQAKRTMACIFSKLQ